MLDEAGDDDVLALLDVRADAYRELRVASYALVRTLVRRRRLVVVTRGLSRPSRSRADDRSRASRRARRPRVVDILDRLLARPRESLGRQLDGSRYLAVQRLLDPRLLLALEQRVVLELVAVQVAVERHVAVEPGVTGLEVEVLADRLGEEGLRVHGLIFEFRHGSYGGRV